MEGDEIHMSRQELQKWIRSKVKKSPLMISDVLDKCNLLHSLLEKREHQAAQLLRLYQSVSECEATVKKQYSLLGWKYRDSDSDDDEDDITDCGNTVPSPPATNGPAPLLQKLQYSENLHRDHRKDISSKREPVVILTRVSSHKISSSRPGTPLMPPTPLNPDSEDDSLSNAGSDMQWEPQDDSSDSDFSLSSNNSGSNKRRKIDQQNKKPAKSHTTPQASTSTDAKSNVTKASTPPANTNSNTTSNITQASTLPGSADPAGKSNVTKASALPGSADPAGKSNVTKASALPGSADPAGKSNVTKASALPRSADPAGKSNVTKASTPQASANTANKSNARKTYRLPATTKEVSKIPPKVPQGEVKVNMTVLARQKAMNWQQGKITDIITKGDRVKYKVHIEEKWKSLVSGHHIAYDYPPKVEQLRVGARVLVRRQADQSQHQFCAGILAELPSRKNRMRFLVFYDDHTTSYVNLASLRLVCRPLENPLDDVPDEFHKEFLKEYLNAWPYPPQTQYRIGQTINVELKGVLQRCDVKAVDCSLIQIVVMMDQHTEWMYRGSRALIEMVKSKGHLESKKKSPEVNESSK